MTPSADTALSAVTVGEAMRRQVVRAETGESISSCIARMVKYKTGAVLVEDGPSDTSLGVISKTDVVGMFYAGLGGETRAGDMAVNEPVCCRPGDKLETALATMLDRGIRRVYVREDAESEIAGVIGYADIVGAMYRFCVRCRRNLYRSGKLRPETGGWLTVQDVMHSGVTGCFVSDPLLAALETLLEGGMGAVAVFGESGRRPRGVLSMTDAILAYRHGTDPQTAVERIMSAPVLTCHRKDYLTSSLRTMILADVQRIFVSGGDYNALEGVISLTDAARSRSGACRACRAARL